jgi:hypothetical protein
MDKRDVVILYLSISLAVTQWFYLKVSKQLSYELGKESVYTSFIDNGESVTYTKGK